jgi:wobble nucleotide-excising tRNase
MEYIKVKDRDHLVRDTYSNGLVNTDIDGYNKYVASYQTRHKDAQKIKNMEEEISSIKNDLNDIKNLLRSIANGSTS